MTWTAIPSLLTVSFLITVLQWRWMRRSPRKERIVYWTLLAVAWLLAVLLFFFPQLPGPSQCIDALFGRIGIHLINGGRAGS